MTSVLWIILLAGLGLLALLAVGILVLIKLGVIASYALKEEPPEGGVYSLDQSRESGDE
jgi:uncharacterized protein YneF (UPF0154 family)